MWCGETERRQMCRSGLITDFAALRQKQFPWSKHITSQLEAEVV